MLHGSIIVAVQCVIRQFLQLARAHATTIALIGSKYTTLTNIIHNMWHLWLGRQSECYTRGHLGSNSLIVHY